jgi:hypothetical protein
LNELKFPTIAQKKISLNSIVVRLGEWDTSITENCKTDRTGKKCLDEPPAQDIAIEKIIAHESYRYSDRNIHDDIALIRLLQPAQLNSMVSLICLPQTIALRSVNLVGETVFVTGWGLTEHSEASTKCRH